MKVFLDSSALVKRYVYELGTDQVLLACRNASEIILSVICAVELFSALTRRKREGLITGAQYKNIKLDFTKDLKEASIVELYPIVVRESIYSLEKAPLRSLDAIQLASAIVSDCDLFITSDTKQGAAAKRRKLKVQLV